MEPITWFVNDRGNLEVHLDDEEARVRLKQEVGWTLDHPEQGHWTKWGRWSWREWDEELQAYISRSVGSCIALEGEWLESLIANSSYEWILPEEIGALTNAPIVGEVSRNNKDEIEEIHSLFWYPNYAIRSFLEDLAETGKCIFDKAPEVD